MIVLGSQEPIVTNFPGHPQIPGIVASQLISFPRATLFEVLARWLTVDRSMSWYTEEAGSTLYSSSVERTCLIPEKCPATLTAVRRLRSLFDLRHPHRWFSYSTSWVVQFSQELYLQQ
jgi:hypothetical protein